MATCDYGRRSRTLMSKHKPRWLKKIKFYKRFFLKNNRYVLQLWKACWTFFSTLSPFGNKDEKKVVGGKRLIRYDGTRLNTYKRISSSPVLLNWTFIHNLHTIRTELETRGRFQQHFTCAFLVCKCFAQIYFSFVIFGAKIWAQKWSRKMLMKLKHDERKRVE